MDVIPPMYLESPGISYHIIERLVASIAANVVVFPIRMGGVHVVVCRPKLGTGSILEKVKTSPTNKTSTSQNDVTLPAHQRHHSTTTTRMWDLGTYNNTKQGYPYILLSIFSKLQLLPVQLRPNRAPPGRSFHSMMMRQQHPLLFVLLLQLVALSSLLLLLRTTSCIHATTTSNSHVSFTSVMAWHRPTTAAVFTRRSSNYCCCSNDSQFIYMLSRGGGGGGDGDSSHNNSHMNNHIDGSADDMDHIQNSIDIPIETSFPTTTSTSTSSSSSNSNSGSMTLETPPAVVDTVETTTAPPVQEKDIPPPAATSTMTAAVATVTTTNATVSAVVATAAVHRTALIQQIVTTLVTTTTTVKEHLSRTPQQIVQATRIIYENLQPYIPRNTQYTLQLSQTHQHQHSILILMVASVLAMHSGYLNGLGLFGLATAVATSTSTTTTTTTPTFQAVAAVTSAYTNLGLQIARGNIFRSAMVPLRCIISYLMGSFVTGFIVHHVPLVPYEITTYPVSMIFAIGTMALFMASNLLSSNQLSMNIFYLLTFVNGLQNSFTSIYSHNQIRSSHYTGMTSDTGTYLGQYIRSTVRSMTSSHEDDAKSKDLTKTLLPKIYRNTILSTSFIVGGMLSYWISQSNGIQNAKSVLLPSLLLYMTMTLLSLLWKPIESSTNPLTSPV